MLWIGNDTARIAWNFPCAEDTPMTGRWTIFAIAAALHVLPLPSLAAPADTLWQKAVAVSKSNYKWMPGTIHEREDIYDKKGNLKDTGERTYRFLLKEDHLDVELVSATKNGKDALEDAAKEFEKEKEDLLGEDREGDPFHSDNQDAINLHRLDRTEFLDGVSCVVFEYEIERKGRAWSGTAWLDDRTGAPLRTCIRPVKFPHKIKKVEFSELRITTYFKIDGDGRWVSDRMVTDGRFKVKPIPFYTFKGRFEETTLLSDHWLFERGD